MKEKLKLKLTSRFLTDSKLDFGLANRKANIPDSQNDQLDYIIHHKEIPVSRIS